jgi:heme/copper-type cytochrome/quinol oxidase subunit 2
MKRFILYSIILIGMFVIGVSYGQTIAKTKKDTKAQVDVFKFGKMVDITVLPHEGYKWNTDYPSTLKFSVCNEYECIFVTEKIKIKKD